MYVKHPACAWDAQGLLLILFFLSSPGPSVATLQTSAQSSRGPYLIFPGVGVCMWTQQLDCSDALSLHNTLAAIWHLLLRLHGWLVWFVPILPSLIPWLRSHAVIYDNIN